jgi:DNA-binding transcriptional regulator YbjK
VPPITAIEAIEAEMNKNTEHTQQIAAQILAGLLSNPHIYANMSDEGAQAPQEQELIGVAIEMAEHLIARVEHRVEKE